MTANSRFYPPIQGESEDELIATQESESENLLSELLGEEEFEHVPQLEEEFEFEFESAAAAELARATELEDELESEQEEEAEGFVNPVRRIYRDAEMMAHLAARAERTDSEAEAEAFVGALVPIAARLIPRAASVLARNAPAIIKTTTRVARTLRRDPATRRLVRALPVVLQRTAQSLADQAASGRDIDANTALRTFGTITGRVLGGPSGRRAVRAVDVFDRRWHERNRWSALGTRPARRNIDYGRTGRRVRRG